MIALALLLAGCAGGPPTIVLDTPTGPTTLYSPNPEVPGAPPPPGLSGPPIPTPPVADLSGTYAGVAAPLDTGGGLCIANQKVGGFRVRGHSVRYGQFRGTIAPDNGLQMVFGQTWIFGQFEGATFHGQIDIPGRFGAPGCTYLLTLDRVGT
jgi:hypothetical protein